MNPPVRFIGPVSVASRAAKPLDKIGICIHKEDLFC